MQRLEKAHSLEEYLEARRKQGSGSAAIGGDEGAPGVLGVSSGIAAMSEGQEPLAGMRAIACRNDATLLLEPNRSELGCIHYHPMGWSPLYLHHGGL